MAGPLSLEAIVNAVQNGLVMTAMAADIAGLRQSLATDGQLRTRDGSRNASTLRPMRLAGADYTHEDGVDRRVPHTWTFPSLPLQNMYVYWHCGDEAGHIPPMKWFEASDVNFLKRGLKKLSEIRRVMQFLDTSATSAGVPPKEHMTHMEANACYMSSQAALKQVIPDNTPTGRTREKCRKLMVGTVYKYVSKRTND